MTIQEIESDICTYLIETMLIGGAKEELMCSKNLFTDYGLDSIAIIEMILYMEEKYKIEFQIFDVDFVELKTVHQISLKVFNMIMKKGSKVC